MTKGEKSVCRFAGTVAATALAGSTMATLSGKVHDSRELNT